jgi:hypothetical protein
LETYLTAICLGLVFSALGMVIVNIPFSSLASTLSTSMSSDRLINLENFPASLSLLWYLTLLPSTGIFLSPAIETPYAVT